MKRLVVIIILLIVVTGCSQNKEHAELQNQQVVYIYRFY